MSAGLSQYPVEGGSFLARSSFHIDFYLKIQKIIVEISAAFATVTSLGGPVGGREGRPTERNRSDRPFEP